MKHLGTNKIMLDNKDHSCEWPENNRFKDHIVAFSHMEGLLYHLETPKMSAFMQPSPLTCIGFPLFVKLRGPLEGNRVLI